MEENKKIEQEKENEMVHLVVTLRTRDRIKKYGEMGDSFERVMTKILDKLEERE